MIANDAEYQRALERLRLQGGVGERQREAFVNAGSLPMKSHVGMEPLLLFHAKLVEAIERSEAMNKRRRQAPE